MFVVRPRLPSCHFLSFRINVSCRRNICLLVKGEQAYEKEKQNFCSCAQKRSDENHSQPEGAQHVTHRDVKRGLHGEPARFLRSSRHTFCAARPGFPLSNSTSSRFRPYSREGQASVPQHSLVPGRVSSGPDHSQILAT